jgi:hypothetical protein
MQINEPSVAKVKDGTFEVRVPITGHAFPHVLANSFNTEEEARAWLRSNDSKAAVTAVRINLRGEQL